MKAMLLREPAPSPSRPLESVDLPVPEPRPDELRVRVLVCGVCRTDLHLAKGELAPRRLPIVPGHEIVGRVEARGSRVQGIELGARVGIAWLRATCGACEHCRAGETNLCPHARFTGWDEHGGYAEHALVPSAWCYPIPEVFGDEEAAPLLCAGIIGWRALRLSGVRAGERLGLYGFGASAHLVLQLARSRGCEVSVCSLAEEHRELARELGAAWVGEAGEPPPRPLHGAILFAPAGELVPPALRALRPGGTLACAGIHMTDIPALDYERELFREKVLRSVTANTREDGLGLLAEAASAGIRPRTRSFALEEANEALIALDKGEIRGAAVLRCAPSGVTP